MNTKIMYIFTQTPLHIGSGSEIGIIDSPVQRERHTGFPIIAGSSIKGVVRADCEEKNKEIVKDIFGDNEAAGTISFGEGKLLFFPIRSLRNSFTWITCPMILNRLASSLGKENLTFAPVESDDSIITRAKIQLKDTSLCMLEEYEFSIDNNSNTYLENVYKLMEDVVIRNSMWNSSYKERIAVVSDEAMSFFAKMACSVTSHNEIEDATGVVKGTALFNIETVPSETIFYSELNVVREKKEKNDKIFVHLEETKTLQFGACATTGLGFTSITLSK